MNYSTRNLFCRLLVLLFFVTAMAFESKCQSFRLGRIDSEDFIQGEYEKDPDASAVILNNYGSTRIDYDTRAGRFYYIYRREMRIQILDERGFDWADYSIPLIGEESMSRFNGYVHNLENGRIKTTRVRSRDGMTEQVSDSRKAIKFSFPEIKPGSLIEIGYNVRSPYYYNLPTWQFQYSIPVEYSEYELTYPEYFNFQTNMQGYVPLHHYDQKSSSTSYSFPGQRRGEPSTTISATTSVFHWIMKDIPALQPEPFTNSIRNYLSLISFELSSLNFPGRAPTRFVINWNDVDKRLQESDHFWGFLNGSRQLRQEMRELDQMDGTEMDKIASVLKYINDNIRWNGYNGVFASNNPRQVLRLGEGNAADVNLMLIAGLRQLGFDANPVVLSTRSNGVVLPVFPTISRFNYVLAIVYLGDGKSILLDATDPFCPPGMLPARALNGQGRLVGENFGQWVDLQPQHPSLEQKTYNFSLDQNGNISATAKIINSDYAALSYRQSLENSGDIDAFKEKFQGNVPGMVIQEIEIENQKEIFEPLIKKLKFSLSDAVNNAGDMLFFKPLLFEGMETNPFALEERLYPVDFTYPQKEEITILYDIPEGFEVDFLPEAVQTNFKRKAFFSFSTSVNDNNQIEVKTTFEITDHMFLPNDYNGLKNFYTNMVEKHNEQISLKSVI